MSNKTDSLLEQALIDAAIAWHSARLYLHAMKGRPFEEGAASKLTEAEMALGVAVATVIVHRAGITSEEAEILIAASSLGTPESVRVREQASPEMVKQALRRADELEAKAAYAEVKSRSVIGWNYSDYETCFVAGFMKARGHE